MKTPSKQRLIAPLVEPYARYQKADILHALRLGSAIVVALIVNHITQLPHGEWTTITIFIILGLLQYQGAIYTKAKERVLGTLLGIAVGLGLLWLGHVLTDFQWLHYLIIGGISGVIGYYAIKQLGYIGLLTGITMCMIIASTSDIGTDGMFRALNVLVGTLIAVMATLVLPLKSTLMWRFLLANNLEACAEVYDGVEAYLTDAQNNEIEHVQAEKRYKQDSEKKVGRTAIFSNRNNRTKINDDILTETTTADARYYAHVYTEDKQDTPLDLGATTVISQSHLAERHLDNIVDEHMVEQFKNINKRLLRVRGHIAATAGESGINTQILEQIQRTHRNIIGTIDLLLSAAPRLIDTPINEDNRVLLEHYHRELTQALRHIAAVLRSPSDEVFRPITKIQVSNYPSIHHLGFDWQGYFWLTQTLQSQLQSMSDLLKQTKPQWFKASGLRYQRQERRRITAHGGESELDV